MFTYSLHFPQNAKARLKVQESELKSLRWEHEVLEQRFAQVQSVSEIDTSSSYVYTGCSTYTMATCGMFLV